MADYTIVEKDDALDPTGDYPGEMRMFTGNLGCEEVAFTYRVMPEKSGGKGSYGHRHKTQEEVYFVISGKLQFKLDDEIVDVGPGTAVRIAPGVVRSVWNEGPEEATLTICSPKVDDPREDAEMIPDFWPE